MTDCNPNCQCFRGSKRPFPSKKPDPIFDLGKVLAEPMTISESQVFQEKHDQVFHQDIMSSSKQLQIEHCTLHLVKIAGILADLAEKAQHGEQVSGSDTVSPRIADLQIFTNKLANLWNLDLERAYKLRVYEVEVRQKL